MAYVAFDLDRTLGYFEILNVLTYLWSPASFNKQPGRVSAHLQVKLKAARAMFADSILNNRALLSIVLRPNLTAVIPQLLKAKQQRYLKSVIIYSNTGSRYSMELAKFLIESRYKCPGFFSLLADRSHPLRSGDYVGRLPKDTNIEPEKTFETLQKLFKKSTGKVGKIHPREVIFMDDRIPKHKLEEQEIEGLTYIIPTPFFPKVTRDQKYRILQLALYALEYSGVLSDKEYLSSEFCNRTIQGNRYDRFADVYDFVYTTIANKHTEYNEWIPDTEYIHGKIKHFLNDAKE